MIAATPDLSVCGEADTVETACQLARTSGADLAIVDLSLGHESGLELLHKLRQSAFDLPVLVLSVHDESLFAERALKAGARGYITKDQAVSDLIRAVRQVLAGRVYLSERASQQLMEAVRGGHSVSSSPLAGLTDRELHVFELIGKGVSTAAIADRLHVSVKTIETYRSNIRQKLHVKDATELLRYATLWIEKL
jgi:DNA-binding NarL/FixJ family response regulator